VASQAPAANEHHLARTDTVACSHDDRIHIIVHAYRPATCEAVDRRQHARTDGAAAALLLPTLFSEATGELPHGARGQREGCRQAVATRFVVHALVSRCPTTARATVAFVRADGSLVVLKNRGGQPAAGQVAAV